MEMKCKKHPKYNGRRTPKHECTKCLSIYLALKQKPRLLPKPTKVIKSKKTYDRKKEKRGGE
jgi:hypothetical protein